MDELEEYLAMPLEDTDIVLLDWWKNHEYFSPSSLRWPSSTSPHPPLDRRCRARVLRRRAHAQRQRSPRKSMKDSTLEHSLFARFNTL